MTDAPAGDDLVGSYKRELREVLERRPSGMRQRLAEELGTTRSFVSQISNPSYPTPIPAQYIGRILEICHFSDGERSRFLTAYRKAHPRRGGGIEDVGRTNRSLTLSVPDFGTEVQNAEFDGMLNDVVQRLIRLIQMNEK